jgi:alpha-galactosidase
MDRSLAILIDSDRFHKSNNKVETMPRSAAQRIDRKSRKLSVSCILAFLTSFQMLPAVAVSPTNVEMADAHAWSLAKFEGQTHTPSEQPYSLVLSHNGYSGFDPGKPLERNAHDGHRLQINGKIYESGVNAHSQTKYAVVLPGKGRRLQADIGIDDESAGCAGTGVIFTVEANGRQVYESTTQEPGSPVQHIQIDLNGASKVILNAHNPDYQDCTDADWANARITMEDGRVFTLGELPIGPLARGYNADLPFSFTYGGTPFSVEADQWKREVRSEKIDSDRTRYVLTYLNSESGLEVTCTAIEYLDYPVVDWSLQMANKGSADTPMIEDVRVLDTTFERSGEGEFLLHHFLGSHVAANDFEPRQTALHVNDEAHFAPIGGRSTDGVLSNFNLEWPNQGVIVAVGWPGQWSATFKRDQGQGIRIQAGQELTHFKLHSGESVQCPRMVLLFWRGDWIRGQNLWRRWMMAHNMPRVNGSLPAPFLADGGMMTDSDQSSVVDRDIHAGIRPDYLWMDAGWFATGGKWLEFVGTWEPAPSRFPQGLRPITENAHKNGVKTLLWFEPERVTPGSWLWQNHPEWLLGSSKEARLLDLGNPAARAWLTDHVEQLLSTQGIDLYREDFNFEPLPRWRESDAPDRQGITEMQDIRGHLAYWDALRQHNPQLIIDDCASGGRRLDIESLARAIPLTRSDYSSIPSAMQQQTYGIEFWIPYFGTSITAINQYVFESEMTPVLEGLPGWKEAADLSALKGLIANWRQISSSYYGDYFPLTEYSTATNVWIAWQLNRPETGEGFVQAFRREDSPFEAAKLPLHGLDPSSQYMVQNLEDKSEATFSGKSLMQNGLPVTLTVRPSSAEFVYRKMNE